MELLYLLLILLIESSLGKSPPSTNIDQTFDPTLSDFKGCGYRNVNGIGSRITDNKEDQTNLGEFPWMVAIFKEKQQQLNKTEYKCGGSLITPSVILTAAHCVLDGPANTLKIRAGEWDPQNQEDSFPTQDRNVVNIVMHKKYDDDKLYNNIALVFVSPPFELNEHIQPVCLPPSNMIFDDLRCFVTGWGTDILRQFEQYQKILKRIEVPIVSHKQCQESLRETCIGRWYTLHKSFLCAGGELGKDTCDGDGGSPLVCPIANTTNRYYQAGIVSWGIGNCGTEIPGVYTNISNLREWIDQTLAREKHTPSSYFTP